MDTVHKDLLEDAELDASITAKDAVATKGASGFGVAPTALLGPDLPIVGVSGVFTPNETQGIAGGPAEILSGPSST